MSLQAFIDESYRSGQYLVCAVVVDSSDVQVARKAMRAMLKGSQSRVHMAKENAQNKDALLDGVAQMRVIAHVVTIRIAGKSQRSARDACLNALTSELDELGVTRMVIESCDQDKRDNQVIGDKLARRGSLDRITVIHLRAREDPLLWTADIIAWAYGRSGTWKKKIAGMLGREIRL